MFEMVVVIGIQIELMKPTLENIIKIKENFI
jgi:hypothetical protein